MKNPFSSLVALLRRKRPRKERAAEDTPVQTLLATDVVLKGTVMSSGDIYLLGKVDGDIVCDRLFFAGDGTVNGTVNARQQIFLNS